MKNTYKIINTLLIFCLFLQVNAKPLIVRAQTDEDTLTLKLITPYKKKMCIGQKINLTFLLQDGLAPGAPRLVPGSYSRNAVVNIKAEKGKISPARFIFYNIVKGWTYTGKFAYTMKAKGSDKITITAEYLTYKRVLEFTVNGKGCEVSITFNKTTLFSQGQVVIDNTYSGAGTLKITDDGKITGTGSQKIWGAINPYSEGTGSCVQNPPWVGSSGITFSGEKSEDEINAYIKFIALNMNSSTLTCKDDVYSGNTKFPSYAYSDCQVQLEGLNFEGGSLDLKMDCPGEDPYNLSVTATSKGAE